MQNVNPATPARLQFWFSAVSEATREAETGVAKLFSASEKERLDRIGSASRRREYLLSRALMRHALSRNFTAEEAHWRFLDRAGTTPEISNLPANTHVSLSHSKGFICFGIGNCALGLDLEAADKLRNFPALAKAFMNDEELASLATCYRDPAEFFYLVWSAKEAYYKSLPPAVQADMPFRKIRFSDLTGADCTGSLFTARVDRFMLAAVTADRPETIDSDFFLLERKTLTPVQSAI